MECLNTELSDFFFQMYKVSDFNWKELISSLKDGKVDISQITEKTICHPRTKTFPPSSEYIKLFLKRLINELEEQGIEVSDVIYNTYINLVSNSNPEDEYYYRTYTLNKLLKVTLRETKNLIIQGTTGLTTWQASHVLSKYCIDNSDIFKRKKVLELGSGLGLTGIATIKSSDLHSYTFTDHHPKVLEYLKHNIFINFNSNELQEDCVESESQKYTTRWHQTDIYMHSLDWETSPIIGEYDFIIGADIIFDKRVIPYLTSIFEKTVRRGYCQVILASAIRNEETFQHFMKDLESRGIPISKISTETYRTSISQPSTHVKLLKL